METSYRMLEVFSFHDRQNEGLTSFHKNNRVNFSGKKGEFEAFQGVYFPGKTWSQNLVLVVVLFLAGHEEDVAESAPFWGIDIYIYFCDYSL